MENCKKPVFEALVHQQKGIDWIIENEKCALFLPMGSGKTAATLKALQKLREQKKAKRILIIGPLPVISVTWPQEIEKWRDFEELSYTLVHGNAAKRLAALHQDVDLYLINKEMVDWLCSSGNFDFDTVVIDEMSAFKNSRSRRWQALKNQPVNRMIGLSATPAPKGYMDLWAQVYLLDHGFRLEPYLQAFEQKYFDIEKQGRNWTAFTLKEGARDQIEARISDLCLSSENRLHLPVRNILHHIRLGPRLEKEYEHFKNTLILNERIDAISPAVLCTKLQQFCSGQIYDSWGELVTIHDKKIRALKRLMNTIGDEPVVIFYQYRHEAIRIKNALAHLRVCDHLNKEVLEWWNEKKVDVLLLQPQSYGHGLNLQYGSHRIIWYSLPNWNLETYLQANGRICRQGQKNLVEIHHLIVDGSIEQTIMACLKARRMDQNCLLEHLQQNNTSLSKRSEKKNSGRKDEYTEAALL